MYNVDIKILWSIYKLLDDKNYNNLYSLSLESFKSKSDVSVSTWNPKALICRKEKYNGKEKGKKEEKSQKEKIA